MSVHSFRTPITLAGGAAIVAASLWLGACAAEKAADERPLRDGDAAAAADGSRDDEPSSLATLAERDVEAFRKLREQREAGSELQDDGGDVGEVQWNLPGTDRHGVAAPDAAPESELGGPSDFEPLILPREKTDLISREDLQADAASDEQDQPLDERQMSELIADLSRVLYEEASYADMPLRELMLIAAMTMVDADRAISPDAIPGLTQRERELLAEFQNFFRKLGKELDGSREADDVLMESIEALRLSLRTDPELAISNIALCTRVGGFADYDRFSRYSFLAHTEQQAIVYIEIDGFTSKVNEKGDWITKISQQLVIYSDRDGIPVWREDWQTAVDTTRQKRSDFFLVQLITLPRALSVGRYQLKVRIRDEATGAEAESAIPIEMVADPKLAAGAR